MFYNMPYYVKSSVPHVVQPGNFILRKLVDWQPACWSVNMKNISRHSSCELWDVFGGLFQQAEMESSI